jgi:hypothetical protein
MNTKSIFLNRQSNTAACECSVAALSKRLYERTLTISEVVELSEKCGLWEIEKETKKSYSRPFTFAVPANQLFAPVSRIVE